MYRQTWCKLELLSRTKRASLPSCGIMATVTSPHQEILQVYSEVQQNTAAVCSVVLRLTLYTRFLLHHTCVWVFHLRILVLSISACAWRLEFASSTHSALRSYLALYADLVLHMLFLFWHFLLIFPLTFESCAHLAFLSCTLRSFVSHITLLSPLLLSCLTVHVRVWHFASTPHTSYSRLVHQSCVCFVLNARASHLCFTFCAMWDTHAEFETRMRGVIVSFWSALFTTKMPLKETSCLASFLTTVFILVENVSCKYWLASGSNESSIHVHDLGSMLGRYFFYYDV